LERGECLRHVAINRFPTSPKQAISDACDPERLPYVSGPDFPKLAEAQFRKVTPSYPPYSYKLLNVQQNRRLKGAASTP
jgi:hypothetical protein